MLAMKEGARTIMDYPIYYHECYEELKKSGYDIDDEQWANNAKTIVSKLKLDANKTLYVLTVGCGNGKIDEPIIDNLLTQYSNIMYIAVDPAANELLKFKDLVKTKAEEWYNVIFDFQDITIEQYLEVNGTRQFGMIVASHSVYYWNNLETTTMELYSSLLKGGMMFFKITGGGWEKLCAKVGKYYLDPDCNFIGVHTIEDIFKRNRPNVNYQTERRELWVDVTECFNEKSQTGSHIIDFITHVYKSREHCKPEIIRQILYDMRNECCNNGDEMYLLNTDEISLIIFRE